MPEYNFWDDRTIETNDDTWCPIANDYCLDHTKCSECEIQIEFDKYISEEFSKSDEVDVNPDDYLKKELNNKDDKD